MSKIFKTFSDIFQNFAKLTPTNKLIVGVLALATVLMFAVNGLYKINEAKNKETIHALNEILQRCQEEKRELEIDYLNYLKQERAAIEGSKEEEQIEPENREKQKRWKM